MAPNNTESTRDRRRFLTLVGGTAVTGLSGCIGDDEPGDTDDDQTSEDDDDPLGDDDDTTPEPHDPDAVSPGGRLTYLTDDIAPSLDPQQNMGYGTAEQYIGFETLMEYNQDLELEPVLAEDYTAVDDLTYVFDLREGIQFHDGSEWNASVAAWNFERMLSEYSNVTESLAQIGEVEATDEYELTIHLSEPFAPFVDSVMANAYFVSRAAIEDHDRDDEWMQSNPVGTGPFEFSEWDERDEEVIYTAFDDYWRTDDDGNELPYLDEWVFQAIPEPQTRLQAFESDGNYLNQPPEDNIEDLIENDDYEVVDLLSLSNTVNYLAMNNDRGPFEDPLLREAVYYAIDNEEIRDFIPYMQEINGPLPEHNWGSNPDIDPQHDPDRAEELLAEAGHPDGFDVTLRIWSDDPQYRNVATVVQQQLGEFGIEVELEVSETQAMLQDMMENNWEFAGVHWGGSGHIDPYGNLYVLFHSEGQYNWITNYSNEEVDDLLDEALQTPDRDDRREIYQEVEQLIFEDHPKVWYGRFGRFSAHYDEVQGIEPIRATGYFPKDWATVWIDDE